MFPDVPFGNPSSRIDTSTLRSCLRQWSPVTMMRKILWVVSPLSKRRMFRLNIRFILNPNGTGSLQLGRMGSPCCILIENQSCEDTLGLSATFSERHHETPMQPLILTLRSGNVMNKALIDSMIGIRFNFLFSHRCFKLVLGLVLVNVLRALFLHPLRLQKGLQLFVRTGTLDSVTTRALISASMVPVLNVEANTE